MASLINCLFTTCRFLPVVNTAKLLSVHLSVRTSVCLLNAHSSKTVHFGATVTTEQHGTTTGACMAYRIHRVTCHTRQRQHSRGKYSIYPPIKDGRLCKPEPRQVDDSPRVTTEVPAIAGVGWISRPSAPLGTVDVNNSPTVVTQ